MVEHFNEEEWSQVTELAKKAIEEGRGPDIPVKLLRVLAGGFLKRVEGDSVEV